MKSTHRTLFVRLSRARVKAQAAHYAVQYEMAKLKEHTLNVIAGLGVDFSTFSINQSDKLTRGRDNAKT